jgi:hypothetical protein
LSSDNCELFFHRYINDRKYPYCCIPAR